VVVDDREVDRGRGGYAAAGAGISGEARIGQFCWMQATENFLSSMGRMTVLDRLRRHFRVVEAPLARRKKPVLQELQFRNQLG
jgi:hypothetical protein